MNSDTVRRAIKNLIRVAQNLEKDWNDIPANEKLKRIKELKRIVPSLGQACSGIPVEEKLNAAKRRKESLKAKRKP
jgi:hypothetical protein